MTKRFNIDNISPGEWYVDSRVFMDSEDGYGWIEISAENIEYKGKIIDVRMAEEYNIPKKRNGSKCKGRTCHSIFQTTFGGVQKIRSVPHK